MGLFGPFVSLLNGIKAAYAGQASHVLVAQSATFNTVVDPILKLGYNADTAVAGEPIWEIGVEGDYYAVPWVDGSNHHVHEFYIEYLSPDRSVQFRPIYASAQRDDNSSHSSNINFDIGTAGWPLSKAEFKAGASQICILTDSGLTVNASMALKVGTANVALKPTTINPRVALQGAAPFASTLTANQLYYCAVTIPNACTLTGALVANAGTAAGNVQIALYNSAGTQVAHSASTAMAGTFGNQAIPFTATYAAVADTYYLAFQPSSATAQFTLLNMFGASGAAGQGSFTLPGTITVPGATQSQQMPHMSTY